MSQYWENRPSVGKIVIGCVLALVLGLIQPLAVMFQVMMPIPSVSLTMIAAAALYGSLGAVPVIVLGIVSVLSTLFIFGAVTGIAALLLWMVPALVIMIGIRRRERFSRQLVRGIAVSMAVTVIAVMGVALVYGADVISMVVGQARDAFSAQQELFWQMLEPMYQGATFEEFVEVYYVMFNTLELYYEYYLLSNLLTGALASAAIAVLWGNWKAARRGNATAESYRGLNQWYLPANTTYGMLLMLAAGFVMAKTNLPGAQTAWTVVSGLCQMVFLIQCMAALDRRMKVGRSGSTARAVMVFLLAVFGYFGGMVTFMAIVGAASALFGSKGAARPLIEKYNDKTDGQGR